MRRFAKNDNSAICNYCGQWQPTDLTNQQLEEMDWKCDQCKAKEGTPEVQPTEQDRGSKEISKYDPEYEFLVKLVKILVKEGIPPQEIKSIADAYPFETVDDVGDLAAKLWTLATEKYKIPREWLTKRLPKSSSLKHADLWQAQKETQDMLDHAPGYLAYSYGQDKESKNKSMNLAQAIEVLNKRGPKVISINSKNSTITLTDGSVLSFDDAAKQAAEIDKTSNFTGAEFSRNDVGVNPTLDSGPFSSPEDHGAKPQKSPFPNTNWLPADDQNLDEQPYSNIASAFRPAFSKKAGLDSRYWIAPDGQEFNAGTHHGAWINNNQKVLESYGIKGAENLSAMYKQMLDSGWSRVSNERGFTIQVADLRRVPAYLDDFIAKHYAKGDIIRIGTDNEMVEISDPFPSLQRQVNKALRQTRASLKEADLSGQTVNQIINALHANGGVTWNLSQGNMVGTNNYAVATHPDRAQILDGVDFDRVEEYIISNSDLLDSPENSFGAWSHDGKVYLDVVSTIPDINQAVELGKQHNQIAIWDLKNAEQIPTGGTGEVKQASQQQILPQPLQDEVAAKTSPAYNIALTNYAEAVKRGHEKDRALEYAIKSVSNLEPIDSKKLVELINEYL